MNLSELNKRNKELESAKAYHDYPEFLEFFIKNFNLQPFNGWKEWKDCFGNVLKIKKSKVTFSKEKEPARYIDDLYFRRSLAGLLSISWKVMVVNDDLIIFGNDGRARYISSDGSRTDPAVKALPYIKFFLYNKNKDYVKEQDMYIISLPIKEDIKQTLIDEGLGFIIDGKR